MNAAPCSCRVRTNWIFSLSSSAALSASVSSPGMPKTWRTPSFSRHFTRSWATFIERPTDAAARSRPRQQPSPGERGSRPLRPAASLRLLRHGLLACRRPDPDRLDVRELADPVRGKLPSIAGALHAAEGEPRVRRDHAVHEHASGLDPAREPLAE